MEPILINIYLRPITKAALEYKNRTETLWVKRICKLGVNSSWEFVGVVTICYGWLWVTKVSLLYYIVCQFPFLDYVGWVWVCTRENENQLHSVYPEFLIENGYLRWLYSTQVTLWKVPTFFIGFYWRKKQKYIKSLIILEAISHETVCCVKYR